MCHLGFQVRPPALQHARPEHQLVLNRPSSASLSRLKCQQRRSAAWLSRRTAAPRPRGTGRKCLRMQQQLHQRLQPAMNVNSSLVRKHWWMHAYCPERVSVKNRQNASVRNASGLFQLSPASRHCRVLTISKQAVERILVLLHCVAACAHGSHSQRLPRLAGEGHGQARLHHICEIRLDPGALVGDGINQTLDVVSNLGRILRCGYGGLHSSESNKEGVREQ